VVVALEKSGIAVESLELVQPSLDDVFVAKTGYHLEVEDAGGGDEDEEAIVSALRANLRVIGALGLRSSSRPSAGPQLMAPIIVFPTLLLAIQTGGAGAAVNLRVGGISFPQVDSFLQFMLAGR